MAVAGYYCPLGEISLVLCGFIDDAFHHAACTHSVQAKLSHFKFPLSACIMPGSIGDTHNADLLSEWLVKMIPTTMPAKLNFTNR